MRDVIVPNLKNDTLTDQLVSLYNSLKNTSANDDLNFDLTQLRFACPLLILPICAYINTSNSKVTIKPDIERGYGVRTSKRVVCVRH